MLRSKPFSLGQDRRDRRDGWAEEEPPASWYNPFPVDRERLRLTSRAPNRHEPLAVWVIGRLADDRVLPTARVRIRWVIGPALLQELELIVDRRLIADEHEAAVGRLLSADVHGAERDASSDDEPRKDVLRIPLFGQ